MPKPIPNLEERLYHYKATVWTVTDADTFKVDWDLGRRTFGDEIIRFSRINAVELNHPLGKEAKKYVEDRVLGKTVILHTELDKRGMTKYESFSRFLAEVYYETDEGWINLNDELLEKGYATLYKR